ncbi:DNA-binding response regulator, NarL/FixJ family, contains REC and HTH domains [Marinobacter segnicrescens]|uniref:DNA-binding response regulator, NarL/FixJ family, contains REC and HTH domains n=1 Tax=Marinobacter segnicrescens TaxID=430453 RepID=A0A1I0EWV5_9GAMM|nr:response regulator transcription factor [Marinobacter segnicrescens]SET49985.1 DNA-binding response regulator, NarL/FixJ family, contains REC and HTH domains [Marinobacter segnicrescens]
MRKILVVEDLRDAQKWLQEAALQAFPSAQVSCCTTLKRALLWIREETPDICLVDLKLPDGTGVDFIEACRTRHPGCHQVVTTIYDDDIHLMPALQAGASGYLLKDEPQTAIAGALRSVVTDGSPPLSPLIARRMLEHYRQRPLPGEPVNDLEAEGQESLSPREQQTLALIAEGHTIARAADLMGVSYHTAARHVKNVYGKLGINSRAEAVREAIRIGLYSP